MRTNFVLIDYENVQPATIETLNHEHVKLLIFVGVNQTKVPIEIAVALQQLGERASYIKISGNGSNALDFHIAFYIGQLAAQEPTAYFHIVSKDTGFDPLIQHLKSKKILAKRVQDVSKISTVNVAQELTPPKQQASTTPTPPKKIEVVIKYLQAEKHTKPRTINTLINTIKTIFSKKITEPEILSLINQLKTRGIIQVADTKVSYKLPQ
ncbi:PIN domain-containing protein [Herpetosiphon llansteffanensis]